MDTTCKPHQALHSFIKMFKMLLALSRPNPLRSYSCLARFDLSADHRILQFFIHPRSPFPLKRKGMQPMTTLIKIWITVIGCTT